MLMLAVLPPTTVPLPTLDPSSVKLTVPVGTVAPVTLELTVAVTSMLLPPRGEVVAGVTVSVVDPLLTLIVTPGEVAL